MYVMKNDGHSAVVPGFMLGYNGYLMMPEYSRYMRSIPIFIAGNLMSLGVGAYGFILGSNRLVWISYAIFMATFSVKMLTQRLVRVGINRMREPAILAPLTVRLNAILVAATLALMGAGFIRMDGRFDTALFEAFGVTMIGLAAVWVLALRRAGTV
jgi:hypothetical protein